MSLRTIATAFRAIVVKQQPSNLLIKAQIKQRFTSPQSATVISHHGLKGFVKLRHIYTQSQSTHTTPAPTWTRRVFTILGGSIVVFTGFVIADQILDPLEKIVLSKKDHIEEQMANASVQPGRPETLTPAEELKLKEFWAATLNIFGHSLSGADENDHDSEVQSGITRTGSDASLKKKKKWRLGRSKDKAHGRSESTSTNTTGTSTPASTNGDADDKYGQNKDFQRALASLTPQELQETFWSFVKYDNADALLLRFLRARKWDVEKALAMMVSTIQWRGKEVHVSHVSQSQK